MIQPEKVHLYCRDGYCLTGSFYQHQSSVPTLPILICPATGIRQRFYQAFATWLFEQGYDVLCFDFRGIGESLHGKLKTLKPVFKIGACWIFLRQLITCCNEPRNHKF